MPVDVECPSTIISIKDEIHQDWFQLQNDKIKLNGEAGIKKPLMNKILQASKLALKIIQECNKEDQSYSVERNIESIQGDISHIESTLALAATKRIKGSVYYTLPSDTITDLLIEERHSINSLANNIHLAGTKMIETREYHGGCKVLGDQNQVNEASLAYCEGVPESTRRGLLRDHGTKVEHKLGLHSNIVATREIERGYALDIDYHDSTPKWSSATERMLAVKSVLEEDYGFTCERARETEMLVLKCKGEVQNADQVRELALFMGRLSNIDMLSKEDHYCIPFAVDHALREAKGINRDKGRKAYTTPDRDRSTWDWQVEVCRPLKARMEKESETMESL